MNMGPMTGEQLRALILRMRQWRHKGKSLAEFVREDFESYFHEVMRPGAVVTDEMVFILGAYTGDRARTVPTDTPPQRTLRNDERGALDDVAIGPVDLFRIERMRKDHWWMRLYMPDGEDYVFGITTSGREIRISVETETR